MFAVDGNVIVAHYCNSTQGKQDCLSMNTYVESAALLSVNFKTHWSFEVLMKEETCLNSPSKYVY